MEPFIYHRRCRVPYFPLLFPIPSTLSLRSFLGTLIYFPLFTKIGIYQPDYELPGRFNPCTTHIFDTSVGKKTLSGITGNIFPSVSSCFISLIYGKKRYSILHFLVQPLWCLMYHQHWYTPY